MEENMFNLIEHGEHLGYFSIKTIIDYERNRHKYSIYL